MQVLLQKVLRAHTWTRREAEHGKFSRTEVTGAGGSLGFMHRYLVARAAVALSLWNSNQQVKQLTSEACENV